MKSGIMIHVGSYHKDLTEATDLELVTWLKLQDRDEKIRIVKVLVSMLREVPEFKRG